VKNEEEDRRMNEEEERKRAEKKKRLQPFVTERVNLGRWIF
jgi:hypothetical protein